MFVDLDSLFLNQEQQQLRASLRRFVQEQIRHKAESWESCGRIPREVWRAMGSLGYLSASLSEGAGGSDLGALGALVLAEELARSTFGGVTMSITAHADLSVPYIDRHGSAFLKSRFLNDLNSGDKICAIAVTEPDAGSDVAGLRCSAVRSGDHYVLNGSKLYISNGVHADVYIVAVRTDPQAKGSRGISLFAVEKNWEGFSTSEPLNKTGCKTSDTAQLFFDNVEVPASHLIGEENQGFYYIMSGFQHERISAVAGCIGAAETSITLTLEWLKSRNAFGKTLWDIDSIKVDLARLTSELNAAKHLLYHTAYLSDQGENVVMNASMAKALIPELTNRILSRCVQYHGGMGYMEECPVERLARDYRIAAVAGGATEVMLLEVAKRMG